MLNTRARVAVLVALTWGLPAQAQEEGAKADVPAAKAANAVAMDAYSEGRFETAEKKFDEALEHFGDNDWQAAPELYADLCLNNGLAKMRLGLTGKDHKKWDDNRLWKAEELLTIATEMTRHAKNAEAWYQLAYIRWKMRPLSASYYDLLTENGVKACDVVLTINPRHGEAGLLKGRLLLANSKHRDLEKARDVLLNDLKVFPARAETCVVLSEVYANMGQWRGVEQTARVGLNNAPNDVKLRLWLGKAFWGQSNWGTAADQFAQAADLDPTNFEAVDMWAQAAGRAKTPPDQLIAKLDGRAKKNPEISVADEVKSRVQMAIGRNDDALATLKSLMDRFASKHEKKAKKWALMRIDLYLRKGEAGEDDLVDSVCDMWKIDPKSDDAWRRFWPQSAEDRQQFGEGLLEKTRRLGQWQRGIDIAAKVTAAITAHEESEEWGQIKGQCHWAAYECYANLGQNDEAEKQILMAISLDARQATYSNSYGLLLRYMGKTQAAIGQFEKALEKQINLPWAWENLGSTYLSLGKVREARAALTQGLAWAKDDETQWDTSELEQLQAAQFETWKIRRLLIEAWRLERAGSK